MYTIGINAVYHDSAACLVKDGVVIAAAEEERFTGIKHGKRPIPFSTYELPYYAIGYCLKEAGITLKDIDHVVYSYDPEKFSSEMSEEASIILPMQLEDYRVPEGQESAWDPLFILYIKQAPQFLFDGAPHHLSNLFSKNDKLEWHFLSHHLAHAASAFLPSPFSEAAVMTIDGRGEKTTTAYYDGQGRTLKLLSEVGMPNSLGILYERLTSYLGFLHSSDEYKVMALASYGKPKYVEQFNKLVIAQEEGRYTVGQIDFEALFGPPRIKGQEFAQKHFDLAHSLQRVLEEHALRMAQWLYQETGKENLCLAGGVALNCVMNARLRDEGPFKNIWIQPAAGDAGTALGAALWVDAQHNIFSHGQSRPYVMDNVYLGPKFSDEEIERFLRWTKRSYRKLDNVAVDTARILAEGKIIGWFQGRMEFGPRALGARSILASPIPSDMQQKLNEIKDREDFRPVAPVVLEEEADDWFMNASSSPFMLFVNKVKPEQIKSIPAVCHVDRTARIQTIRQEQNPLYYELLREFKVQTGCPILVNTSFNTQGKPIVCTPRDALECFSSSPLDALVIGSFLLEKTYD